MYKYLEMMCNNYYYYCYKAIQILGAQKILKVNRTRYRNNVIVTHKKHGLHSRIPRSSSKMAARVRQ